VSDQHEPDPPRTKAEGKADRDEVHELVEVGQRVAEGQEATKEAIVKSITADNARFRRRNAVLLTVVLLLLLMQVFQTYRSVFTTGPILDRLDGNQEGIDALVSFVEDVKADAADNEPVDLQVFIRLLCASDDPVRQAACIEIGALPG
jgi:hypothetical protein